MDGQEVRLEVLHLHRSNWMPWSGFLRDPRPSIQVAGLDIFSFHIAHSISFAKCLMLVLPLDDKRFVIR